MLKATCDVFHSKFNIQYSTQMAFSLLNNFKFTYKSLRPRREPSWFENESLTLIVDIGSASVGASLVIFGKGQPPKIIASIRENISFQEVISSTQFLHAMNQALEKVLKALQGKTKTTVVPKHFFCTLSSPWFILKTRKLSISKNEEFEVTERTIEKFVDDEITKLTEELKDILPPQDIRIIEKKIIHIKLNGYEIKNPYKQKTSQLQMAIIVGISSMKVVQSIERKINNFFHAKSVHFGAFPVAAFSAIRDIFPTEKNFLFLDITGEATDVSLIDDDLLTMTVSFPRGKNFFIREISTRFRTVHEEATTLFSMFLRNELEVSKHNEILGIVEHTGNGWLTRFEKVIKTLSENGTLPLKIFFTADTDITPLFLNIISKAKSELLMDAVFDVQYLDQHIVSMFVTFETEVMRDPFIVVETLFAEKLIDQHS